MKTLILILFLFSSSVFANEYSPEKLINFIKNSERIIIKLAKFNESSNRYEYYNDNLGEGENQVIVIDNKIGKLSFEKLKRIKKNKPGMKFNEGDYLIENYGDNNIAVTQWPMTLSGMMTIGGKLVSHEDEKDFIYFVFFDDKEFVNIHWLYRKFAIGFLGEGYCTNRKDIAFYDVKLCEDVDLNDPTSKPLFIMDNFKYKIVSVYDTYSKTFFDPNYMENIHPEIAFLGSNKKEKIPISKLPKKEKKPKTNKKQIKGTGSGFYITSLGHIITNNHVIDGCEEVLLNNETLEVMSVNNKVDLALLKSETLETPFLYLRQNEIKQGEDVVVIGYPFGKDINKESTITKGIISALVGFGDDDSKIQIDAAIQPGNSGGPTIGLDGQVVGVTVASANISAFLEAFGAIAQNMNFSVKPKYVIEMMKANGVEVPISNQKIQMNTSDIYEYADPATVYLECWGRN